MTIALPARQAAQNAILRPMLDHPSLFLFKPPYITNLNPQRTDHMRLTKAAQAAQAAQAANTLAAERAHHAQVGRLNDVLVTKNSELMTESRRMHDTIADHAKALDQNEKDIRAFKADLLALTVANAEMRGYLGRTLEDDAVRESGQTVEQPPQVFTKHDQAMPTRNVRTGPCPPVHLAGCASDMEYHFTRQNSNAMQVQPRPWHDR